VRQRWKWVRQWWNWVHPAVELESWLARLVASLSAPPITQVILQKDQWSFLCGGGYDGQQLFASQDCLVIQSSIKANLYEAATPNAKP